MPMLCSVLYTDTKPAAAEEQQGAICGQRREEEGKSGTKFIE